MSNEGLGKARMEAISDGVFAVAMTLMLADVVTTEGVRVWRENPFEKGSFFLVTFGITSIYWIAHNNECRYIKKTDRLVLWLNLLFVATVALVPASVNMFGLNDSSVGKGFTRIYLWNLVLMGVFLELWFISLMWKGYLTDEGVKQRWATVYRNAAPPLAIAALLAAIWARGFDSLKNADWWLVDDHNIRWALAVPLVGYVLMTLFLQSRKTSWRYAMRSALLVLLICGVLSYGVLHLLNPNLLPNFIIGSFWLILLVLMTVFFVPAYEQTQFRSFDCLISVPPGQPPEGGWPVLVFLHGNKEAAPTPLHDAMTAHGPLCASSGAAATKRFVVVAPQLRAPGGDQWAEHADAVKGIGLDATGKFGGNSKRIYLTGFSFGGNGVLDIGVDQPDDWAALWPVDPTRSPAKSPKRPIWVSGGPRARPNKSTFVAVLQLEDRVGKAAPPPARVYDEDLSLDHPATAREVYADDGIYCWLLTHSLP
jgi:uncharacterized membrane protein